MSYIVNYYCFLTETTFLRTEFLQLIWESEGSPVTVNSIQHILWSFPKEKKNKKKNTSKNWKQMLFVENIFHSIVTKTHIEACIL